MKYDNPALAALRHHITGAIERGEGEAIVAIPPPCTRPITYTIKLTIECLGDAPMILEKIGAEIEESFSSGLGENESCSYSYESEGWK